MYKMPKDCDKCNKKTITNQEKWKFTLITAFIFLLVVNPFTYRLVEMLLGKIVGKIADIKGCPTWLGFAVHTLVFTLLVRYTMELHI